MGRYGVHIVINVEVTVTMLEGVVVPIKPTESVKRQTTASSGQEVVGATTVSRCCNFCGKSTKETLSILQCKQCKAVGYCFQECQKGDWSQHKAICKAIKQLSESESVEDTMFTSHLHPKKHEKIIVFMWCPGFYNDT